MTPLQRCADGQGLLRAAFRLAITRAAAPAAGCGGPGRARTPHPAPRGPGPAQAGQGEPGERPAADDVERASGRARPFPDLGNEQFGELVAVAIAPAARVPAEQSRGAPGGLVHVGPGSGGAAHAVPQFTASRRRPVSVTRAWGQMRLERGRPGGGQPVGPPPIVGFKRLDHPLGLKPRERLVEGAGSEADSGESRNVLSERITVLGAIEARQDQRGRARVLAERGQPAGAIGRPARQHVWS